MGQGSGGWGTQGLGQPNPGAGQAPMLQQRLGGIMNNPLMLQRLQGILGSRFPGGLPPGLQNQMQGLIGQHPALQAQGLGNPMGDQGLGNPAGLPNPAMGNPAMQGLPQSDLSHAMLSQPQMMPPTRGMMPLISRPVPGGQPPNWVSPLSPHWPR